MSLRQKYSSLIARIQSTSIQTLYATATLIRKLPDSEFDYITTQNEVYRIAPKVPQDIESDYFIRRYATNQTDRINAIFYFRADNTLQSITEIQDMGTSSEQIVAQENY